jgi:hypothetical protein
MVPWDNTEGDYLHGQFVSFEPAILTEGVRFSSHRGTAAATKSE